MSGPTLPVSIAMPYFERGRILRDCLDRLADHYPGSELEIVVADDGSIAEKAEAIIGDFLWRRNPGFACKAIYLGPPKDDGLCPCTPINVAVRATTRPRVLIQNPDTIHIAPILAGLLEEIERQGEDAVICAGVWCPDRNEWHSHGIHRPAGYHFCNLMSRSLFDRAGGFDEEYREGQCYDDDDFVQRVKAAGGRYVFRDDLVAHHVWTMGRVRWRHAEDGNRDRFHRKWPVKR